MSATNLYLGINTRNQNFSDSSTIDVASSSTATDYMELRMMTIKADGVTATGLTRQDVVKNLKTFERFIKNGGAILDGTGVPIT
jgi:hypothetical protein